MGIWVGNDNLDYNSPTQTGPSYDGFRMPVMPADGYITQVKIMYGSNSAQTGRIGIHGAQGQVLYSSPSLNYPSSGGFNSTIMVFHTLTTPLQVAENEVVYAGIGHSGSMVFACDDDNFVATGTNWYEEGGSSLVPADLIPGDEQYVPKAYAFVLFEEQKTPTTPVWLTPTPVQNGSTTDVSPELRFSIPHPDVDDTKNVEIELTVLNTGVLWQWSLPATLTDNNNGYFSYSPLTLSPGDQVSVRARHQDLFDTWSAWSATRVFTIFDAPPGQGAWLSPTPAENALVTTSTPAIKGSTPHPGNDSSYDYTTGVQVQVYNADTNAVLQDTIFAPTSADQAADVFNLTLNAIAQNTDAKMRFRHHDRRGTWSPWSDYRLFTMSAGPDLPTISRPKGKVNFRNETEYQAQGGAGALYAGSYNNISGTIMHSVRVQLYNADGTALLYDSGWVARTATAGVWTLPQASFPSHPASLAYATSYKVRANVAESNAGVRGIESGWGPFADFKINAFPDKPASLSPANGQPVSTGQFSANVTDPDGDVITAAAMTLQRSDNNAVVFGAYRANLTNYVLGKEVWQSGASMRVAAQNAGRSTQSNAPVFNTAVPNEGDTVKEIPTTAVARSTAYTVGQCRLRPGQTTADIWFVECTTAGTTAATDPGYASPVDGSTRTDGTATFTYRKPITWKNVGPWTEWTMDVSGNSLTKSFDTSLLTLGDEYQWFARARDETGWGQPSPQEPFRYASVPTATMLRPNTALRTNLVRDPSAEYEGALIEASPFWTIVSPATDNSILRSDESSLYGDYCWKAITTAANSITFRSEKIPVNLAAAYVLHAEFKKLSGTSAMRLRLRCLDSSDAFISNVVPTSILAGSGVNLGSTWQRYGGIIWETASANTPKFPAGTVSVQIEILPSENSAAQLYFDGVLFEQASASGISSGQWTDAQKWYGYFDGDTTSHTSRERRYYWLGQRGIAASVGDFRLTDTTADLIYQFNHTGNLESHRILTERWSDDKNAFVQINDTGFIAQSATPGQTVLVPLPTGVLLNDDRYRFRVQVRDALGISGESNGAIADTDYIGQPEPLITSISSDATKAEVTLEWTATALADASFGGYEIARARREDNAGTYTVLYREMNKQSTRFTDPYPLSDVDYVYQVRVVQLVGVDEQQGRWGRAPMNVNYFPVSFVKDAEDPFNLYAAFETPLESMPTPEEDAITQMMVPWGQSRPTIVTRADMRLRSGSVVANFYADNVFVEDALTRYAAMLRILERRSGICLLLQEPRKRRLFASIIGPWQESYRGVDQRGVEFNYHENSYEEDLRDREESA